MPGGGRRGGLPGRSGARCKRTPTLGLRWGGRLVAEAPSPECRGGEGVQLRSEPEGAGRGGELVPGVCLRRRRREGIPSWVAGGGLFVVRAVFRFGASQCLVRAFTGGQSAEAFSAVSGSSECWPSPGQEGLLGKLAWSYTRTL